MSDINEKRELSITELAIYQNQIYQVISIEGLQGLFKSFSKYLQQNQDIIQMFKDKREALKINHERRTKLIPATKI